MNEAELYKELGVLTKGKDSLSWFDQGDRSEINESGYGGEYDRHFHAQ